MNPRLLVLDVGQGDALIAHNPITRSAVVIDCALPGARPAARYLRDHQIARLSGVVVTHLDADHYAGVPELVRQVPADLVAYGLAKGYKQSHVRVDAFLRQMLSAQSRMEAEYLRPLAGRSIHAPGLAIDVLGPTDLEETTAVTRNDANLASAMVRARIGDLTALLAGDCPPERWSRAVGDYGTELRADVFVIPHHGAAHPPRPYALIEVLDCISPRVVVISVGSGNRHGHPSPETLQTATAWAKERGARVVCTQLNELCRIGVAGRGDKGVPCAGNVLVERVDGQVLVRTPQRLDHLTFLHTLEAPRCVAEAA